MNKIIQDIINQLFIIWRQMVIFQKMTLVGVLITLTVLFGFIILSPAKPQYLPLFPAERVQVSDASDIKSFLEVNHIPYKLQGDSQFLVPEEKIHRLRMELAALGLPKTHNVKGFELFDSNTWMKGEKELQVLEMRAIRGELENDICEYDNIKSASITFDIAPPRSLSGEVSKTKASIILGLKPGARLDSSQLRAITYHVSGAVRGLSPNRVAISDTSGKLYQAIDSDNEFDSLRGAENAVEEHLKAKIDGMLTMVVGAENFYSTVQVTMSREKVSEVRQEGAKSGTLTAGQIKINTIPGKIESISIGVMIDKTITLGPDADIPASELVNGSRDATLLRKEIESQLAKILEGYNVKTLPAVDFVQFDKKYEKKSPIAQETPVLTAKNLFVLGSGLMLLTALAMFWVFNRFWHRHPTSVSIEGHENFDRRIPLSSKSTDHLASLLRGLMGEKDKDQPIQHDESEVLRILRLGDPKRIANCLQREDALTLAHLLSNIDNSKASAILSELPEEKRNAIQSVWRER